MLRPRDALSIRRVADKSCHGDMMILQGLDYIGNHHYHGITMLLRLRGLAAKDGREVDMDRLMI